MSQALAELTLREADFRPSDEVTDRLKQITFVAFIGAMATGKTSTMDQVAQLDSEFGAVRSFTTRPRRSIESGDDYRFINDTEDLDRIVQMVVNRTGGLVQYGVHPTTGHVYGSEIADYNHPYSMLAVIPKNAERMREVPFGRKVELTLVAEPYEWIKRFAGKGFSPSEASQRAIEGKQSLEWSFKQPDMIWVSTSSGTRLETAAEIRALIKGDRKPGSSNLTNKQIGKKLLKTISQFI